MTLHHSSGPNVTYESLKVDQEVRRVSQKDGTKEAGSGGIQNMTDLTCCYHPERKEGNQEPTDIGSL